MHKDLLLESYNYHLPPELIAQEPAPERDLSRLLVYHRKTRQIEHCYFSDIPNYFSQGDLFVFNNTRVFNARIFGERVDTGGRVEVLLLKRSGDTRYSLARKFYGGMLDTRKETDEENVLDKGSCEIWEVLIKPAKRGKAGTQYLLGNGVIEGEILERKGEGIFVMKLFFSGDLYSVLDRVGEVPLPPYIKRPKTSQNLIKNASLDRRRYQTIYASRIGAVAAPTAGLHFSEQIFEQMDNLSINKCFVILHVGLGTFQPLRKSIISENKLHEEYFEISSETADIINSAKEHGKKILTIGTTTARALESDINEKGNVISRSGWTDLFIFPPYDFGIVRNLLTNFHLPKTSLLLMVASLIGTEEMLRIYNEAVKERYRFYSYGDAMLILE